MRAQRFWYFYDLFATMAAARRQKLSLPTSILNSFSLCALSLSVYSVVIFCSNTVTEDSRFLVPLLCVTGLLVPRDADV